MNMIIFSFIYFLGAEIFRENKLIKLNNENGLTSRKFKDWTVRQDCVHHCRNLVVQLTRWVFSRINTPLPPPNKKKGKKK